MAKSHNLVDLIDPDSLDLRLKRRLREKVPEQLFAAFSQEQVDEIVDQLRADLKPIIDYIGDKSSDTDLEVIINLKIEQAIDLLLLSIKATASYSKYVELFRKKRGESPLKLEHFVSKKVGSLDKPVSVLERMIILERGIKLVAGVWLWNPANGERYRVCNVTTSLAIVLLKEGESKKQVVCPCSEFFQSLQLWRG